MGDSEIDTLRVHNCVETWVSSRAGSAGICAVAELTPLADEAGPTGAIDRFAVIQSACLCARTIYA